MGYCRDHYLGKIYLLKYEGMEYVLTIDEAFAICKFAPFLDINRYLVRSDYRRVLDKEFKPVRMETNEAIVEDDYFNKKLPDRAVLGYNYILDYDCKSYALSQSQSELLAKVCPELELCRFVVYDDFTTSYDKSYKPKGFPICLSSAEILLNSITEEPAHSAEENAE